ncbi:transcription termination/antitermination protein NusG (plasmid) [Bradyrhizobium oligotrophicum S58]
MNAEAKHYEVGDFVEFVDLIERAGPVEAPMPKCWYVLQTFAGKEAKVMRAFHDRKMSAYCPMMRKTMLRRGRKVDRVEPLFAQLIFVPDFQVVDSILHVEGVDGLLKFGDWCAVLPDRAPDDRVPTAPQGRLVRRSTKSVPDMAGVRELERIANIPVGRRRRMFKTGQLVRVVDGPFSSFIGQIDRLDSRGRLAILLDIFSRGTPVILDEGQIEAA